MESELGPGKSWSLNSSLENFSGGQATIERGFSVNRQSEQENVDQQSVLPVVVSAITWSLLVALT